MNLRNKLAFFIALNSYVELITRGTSPLSLQKAVANSLSYVKAFGGTEQRKLPVGYQELEYIESTGTQYINMGYPFNDNITAEIKLKRLNNNTRDSIFGYRFITSGTAVGNMRFVFVYPDGKIGLRTGGSASNSTRAIQLNTDYVIKYSLNKVEVDNEVWVTSSSAYSTTVYGNGYIFNANAEGYYSQDINKFIGRVYYTKLYDNGILVFNGIPAKRKSDNVIGMYDTVSGTFFTNAGTGTFAAGGEAVPTPDTPMDIVSNNGVLKARHASGLPLGYTLLEYIEAASGSYIDTRITPTINAKADVKFAPTQTSATGYWGARSDPNRFCCTTFSSGTKFGIGMTNNTWPANRTPITLESIYDCVVANGYASVNGAEYTETPVESFGNAGKFYLGRIGAAKYYKCKLWENNVLVFDGIPAKNANDVIGMYDLVSGQFFTNQGTGTFTAGNPVSDPVEIYTDGTVETIKDSLNNTATTEMLLKVGDYQDVQSIIDGAITRNIGVKVLDGTEDWTYESAKFTLVLSDKINNKVNVLCNYFTYSTATSTNMPDLSIISYASKSIGVRYDAIPTLTQFKQYLADQYNAGTPVIVIYPLATPTTESVAGQTLQVQAGDNTLEITQASLNNLELEAEYKKRK